MIHFTECDTIGMTIYTYNLTPMDLRGHTGTLHEVSNTRHVSLSVGVWADLDDQDSPTNETGLCFGRPSSPESFCSPSTERTLAVVRPTSSCCLNAVDVGFASPTTLDDNQMQTLWAGHFRPCHEALGVKT